MSQTYEQKIGGIIKEMGMVHFLVAIETICKDQAGSLEGRPELAVQCKNWMKIGCRVLDLNAETCDLSLE